jgi:hypothetical protein
VSALAAQDTSQGLPHLGGVEGAVDQVEFMRGQLIGRRTAGGRASAGPKPSWRRRRTAGG